MRQEEHKHTLGRGVPNTTVDSWEESQAYSNHTSLQLREEKVDLKNCDFMIIGGAEFGDINKFMVSGERMVFIFKILLLVSIALALTTLFFVNIVYVPLGIGLYSIGCLVIVIKERLVLEDLRLVAENIEVSAEDVFDVVVVSRDNTGLEVAKRKIDRTLDAGVTDKTILLAFSIKLVLMDILFDIMYLSGTILIALAYLFISLLTFVVLGFCVVYMILDIVQRIIDVFTLM